jgi:uncharacterized repeat protein (TIGR01451 family)
MLQKHTSALTALLIALASAIALLMILTATQPSPVHAQGPDGYDVYYVAPGADCGGVSPCYDSVQAAVDAVDDPGDVVKVAAGTYAGVSARGGATQTVYISKSVTVRGGYTTTNWVTSDPQANPTTLDAEGQGRVLYINGSLTTATIEGLHILHGRQQSGGGIHVTYATVTLRHNEIVSNVADYGGGLHIEDGIATMHRNLFRSNTGFVGGGLLANGSDVKLDGDMVLSNTSSYIGGGVYLEASKFQLVSSVVADNRAETLGSGLFIHTSDVRILHTTLARNAGGDGSGLHILAYPDLGPATVNMINSILVSHTIGITATTGSTATLENTLWGQGAWANEQDWGGPGEITTGTVNLWQDPGFVDPASGDYHIRADSAARDNGTQTDVKRDFDDEFRPMGWSHDIGADEYTGVGLEIINEPSEIMVNRDHVLSYTITITGRGNQNATGVLLTDTLSPWQRAIAAVPAAGTCTIPDDGWGGRVTCSLNTVPVDAAVVVTVSTEISPSTWAGQELVNRVVITAHETTNSTRAIGYAQDCHVRINADDREFTAVQDAVDAASPGDLIKVAGTCVGVKSPEDGPQQVHLDKSLTIRGGYAPGDWTTSRTDIHPTTLDALGQGRVFYISGDAAPLIENLDITGGNVTGLDLSAPSPMHRPAGGGILVYDTTPTISNTHVFSNSAGKGGGIYLDTSNAILTYNTIIANLATDIGGGLGMTGSQPQIHRNIIKANVAKSGGGIFASFCNDVLFTNNVIADNTAYSRGGGLYSRYTSAKMLHTTLARNGSGVYLERRASYSPPFPINSIAMTNTILISHTTGVKVLADTEANFSCTLWGNEEDWDISADSWSGPGTIITGTCNYWGNPDFVAPNQGDYHIGPNSMARDVGLDTSVDHDIDGDPRPYGPAHDIGADEWVLHPDLALNKQAHPAPARPGQPLTYTLTLTNTGDTTLHATVTDTLPLHILTGSTPGGTLLVPRGTLTWTTGAILPGGVWTATVVVTVETGYHGLLTNTVEATTPEGASGIFTHTVDTIPPYSLIAFSSPSFKAGESAGQGTITATLSTATAAPVTVGYSTQDGTATAGADYLSANGVLTFAPGTTTQTFGITLTDDPVDEPDETILLSLRDPAQGTLGTVNTATLTIQDDDALPTIAFARGNWAVDEGIGSATLTVTLSAASGKTVTVHYETNDGTATAGTDYGATSGMLTFAPGVSTRTLGVTIHDDGTQETDETLALALSGAINAKPGTTHTATVTILDNDLGDEISVFLPLIVKSE